MANGGVGGTTTPVEPVGIPFNVHSPPNESTPPASKKEKKKAKSLPFSHRQGGTVLLHIRDKCCRKSSHPSQAVRRRNKKTIKGSAHGSRRSDSQ